MKNKLMKLLALVAGLSASTLFGAGDILEILPCDVEGNVLTAAPATAASPLGADVDCYFKFRLVRTSAMKANNTNWEYDFLPDYTGSRTIAEILNPLKIGIYVSGQVRWADYVTTKKTGEISEAIFHYKTMPGDFALPIRLAGTDGKPAGFGSDSPDYLFLNSDVFWFVGLEKDGEVNVPVLADMHLGSGWRPGITPQGGFASGDSTLAKSGFYVKTVGFDENNEGDGYWRKVHAESNATLSYTPRLQAPSSLTNSVTVYVWSKDDSVVWVEGEEREMVVGYGAGGTEIKETHHVATIVLDSTSTNPRFVLHGGAVGKVGQSTQLVLSGYDHYNFESSNDPYPDYVTVDVLCTDPLPATLVVEADTAEAVATSNWSEPAVQLSIYVTQALEEEATVTIDPVMPAGSGNWWDYFRFTTDGNLGAVLPVEGSLEPPTVTIPANKTDRISLFLHAIRSDATVQNSDVILNPSDIGIERRPASFKILAAKPVIKKVDGLKGNFYVNEDHEFTIRVDDIRADLLDQETGYTVTLTCDGEEQSSSGFVVDNGVLKGKADGSLPKFSFPDAGEFTATLKIKSPISGEESEQYEFTANVKSASEVTVETVDGTGGEYYESDTDNIHFKITLTETYNKDMWAFLEPVNTNFLSVVATEEVDPFILGMEKDDDGKPDKTLSRGILIATGDDVAEGAFHITDAGKKTLNAGFKVILCTSESYDESAKVARYSQPRLKVSVKNRPPSFSKSNAMKVDGVNVSDGQVLRVTLSKGQPVSIVPQFEDVEADVKGTLKYYWTILAEEALTLTDPKEDVEQEYDPARPETKTGFTYDFPRALPNKDLTRYAVLVRVADKDMNSTTEPELPEVGTVEELQEAYTPDSSDGIYVFYVDVMKEPTVSVTSTVTESDGVYNEYLSSEALQTLRVNLSSKDAQEAIAVKLTVTYPEGENPGIFKLDAALKRGQYGYPDLDAGSNEYYVFFSNPGYEEVRIANLDGTALSMNPGFTVKAEVIGDETGTGARHPKVKDATGDEFILLSEYYKSTETNIRVRNVDPQVEPRLENTNAWIVASGPATAFPIWLTFTNEALGDYAGIDSFPGIQVSFVGCPGGSMDQGVTQNADGKFYITKEGTYSFIPEFGVSPGEQSVTVTVKDKDGRPQSWTYLYKVTSSKMLKTTASGPAGGVGTLLSRRYAQAKGRGMGHVGVGGYTVPDSGSLFTFVWNCQKSLNAVLYGIGYKVGAVDNGGLNYGGKMDPFDFAVSEVGGLAAGADAKFAYPDATRDSYLYTWLVHTFGENGGVTSSFLSDSAVPEIAGGAPAPTPIALPGESSEDGGYQDTWAEAIFSKERYPLDNCGDINQDGIPDRILIDYPDLGVAFDGTADLADLSGFNNDNDFLPALSTSGNRLVPSIASDWATKGGVFNAFLEVRGFGSGLNAGYKNADGSDPAPDYSANEKRAYLAWKEIATVEALQGMGEDALNELFNQEANLAHATADLAAWNANPLAADNEGWSPERPTDPTVADTDKDGLDDGYEYWFWYGAKVGYYDKKPENGGKWQGPMKGRRLNLGDLDNFDEIPSAEICLAFDPLTSAVSGDNDATRGSIADRDFDGDGLYDIEEYLIGTNPVDCDTDDDGIPDGIELVWGQNPLVNEPNLAKDNPDGDCMAYGRLDEYLVGHYDTSVEDDDGEIVTVKRWLLVKSFENGVLTGYWFGNGETLADVTRTIGNETIPGKAWGMFSKVRIDDPEILNGMETEWAGTLSYDADGNEIYEGLVLIHDQVYKFFGFDPRTAWSSGCMHGFVTQRWCPICNGNDDMVSKVGEAGLVVRTRAYTTKQEYLFAKYRGFRGGKTVLEKLLNGCTNPGVPFEAKTYGEYGATFSSDIHGADTDGNGVPDGWEAYVGFDPRVNPGFDTTSESDVDPDPDGLSMAGEFCCLDGAAYYAECETIAANTPANSGWFNKFFPTDPNNEDTDGDGLFDGAEGKGWNNPFYAGRKLWSPATFTFIYGENTDDGTTLCFRGGGMNPCSTDTDLDGLPDAWEHDFAGIVVNPDGSVVGELNDNDMYTDQLKVADGFGTEDFAPEGQYIAGGMDATDPDDAFTNPLKRDKWLGTFRDRDFDRDGLENFQEYLVQSVRCWRYDDTMTPLMGRIIQHKTDFGDPELIEAPGTYLVHDILSGSNMLALVKSSAYAAAGYAAGENDYASIVGEYDYSKLGYFAPCTHDWDPAHFNGLGQLKYGGDLGMRYMRRPRTPAGYLSSYGQMLWNYSLAYVSTDPRQWDTDADGMDDFWEIFHGLNPILGAKDIISLAYIVDIDCWNNVWTELTGVTTYDPVKAPWLMGLPEADPDGDGIRNLDEAVSGNLTSPTTYHTDPTPLWMTEPSTEASYVRQFYSTTQGDDDMGPDLLRYPWVWFFSANGAGQGSSSAFKFAFERTEGYDTDGDWSPDGREVVRDTTPLTDPLDANDPDRRAALYLPGADACAYSAMEGNMPVYDGYDMFRQFTVEAWVKPERVDRAQTVVERGFAYPMSNLVNAEDVWRANFRLEIDAAGVARGVFDNDNAVATGVDGFSSQTLAAGKVEANVWTHLAMSYDGTNVCMYVNGELRASAKSRIIPANGIVSVLQEPGGTNSYPSASYNTLEGANTVGARRTGPAFDWDMGFDQFTDFFQGYIAEVRFWDGARTAGEIAGTYATRMTPELAAANREAVYLKWRGTEDEPGATRNDADGRTTLPAQLISVYNFQQLPAAASAGDVSTSPSGFENGVQANTTLTADETKIGWWEATPLKSTVYTDTRVVPYAQNLVSHLPLLDGAFEDTMFWSGTWAGYTSASDDGVKTFAIPNGGNPYKGRSYMMERSYRIWRYSHLMEARPEFEDAVEDLMERSTFQNRSEFIGLDDLVPLGGAYAKLDGGYWDGLGASTVWNDTGADSDGDGLPDWWEAMYGDVTPYTMVERNGIEMPAWEAYMRDLAAGMQPDGDTHGGAYASTADADGDGLVDWWQNLYGIKSGANADDDGDGLANYVEYLLSEIFKIGRFDPTLAYSMQSHVSDYFYRVGQSYVGEIFTDHDRIDDLWEDKFGNTYASRYLYDASLDNDGDGWSNNSEFQAGTDPSKLGSLGIDAVQMTEYPVPVVETKLTYEGTQAVAGKPFVVKAWRDPSMQTIPDAVWTIGGEGSTEVFESGVSNTVTGLKYIGMNPDKQVMLHLSPGSIVAGSVEIEFKDQNWILLDMASGQAYSSNPSTAVWETFVIDKQRQDEQDKGDIIYQTTQETIGEIDYVTGTVTLDFSLLPEYAAISGDISSGTGGVGGNFISIYTLASSYLRIKWYAQPIVGGSSTTYYLGDPDSPTEANNSLGHTKEGRNTFVAFCDLDGNGKYTAGEPYGVAPSVDVGWNYAKVNIELTDTTPVTARFSVGDSGDGLSAVGATTDAEGGSEATNDRTALWGSASGNFPVESITIGQSTGGVFQRVRVVRTAINGMLCSMFGVSDSQVVLDKVVNVNNDSYITEADFLNDSSFDIDWTLADELASAGVSASTVITNVSYRVVIGDGSANGSETNNLLGIVYNRWFDTPEVQNAAKPVVLAPGIVTDSAPTFKWTIPGNLNSYTAFQIQVLDGSTVVWSSGMQHMPPRVRDADYGWRYEWTAPLFADSRTPDGSKLFENNKAYKWRVAVHNARYKNVTRWSASGDFRMEVQTESQNFGTALVAVRYFGPDVVATSGKIRVQAFKTPDFSGAPVGEGCVEDVSALADGSSSLAANARIIGLEPGTYYIRAFIDTQSDGKLATWESWGFACDRDVAGAAIYTPKAVKVGPKAGRSQVIPVFVEDSDTDQDNLPDAWEMVQKGALDKLGTGDLDQELRGGVAVKSELTGALNGEGSLTTGLSVMLSSALKSPYVAAMVFGVDVSGASSATDAQKKVNQAVGTAEQTAEPKKVAFNAITLDQSAGTVTLDITTVVDSASSADPALSAIYEIPATGTLEVTLKLWKKDELSDTGWTVVAERQVQVGDGDEKIVLSLGSDVDLASGFFKVSLEK